MLLYILFGLVYDLAFNLVTQKCRYIMFFLTFYFILMTLSENVSVTVTVGQH